MSNEYFLWPDTSGHRVIWRVNANSEQEAIEILLASLFCATPKRSWWQRLFLRAPERHEP